MQSIQLHQVKESIWKEKHTPTHALDLCVRLQFSFNAFGIEWVLEFLARADLVWNLTVHRWFVSFIELVLRPYLDVDDLFFANKLPGIERCAMGRGWAQMNQIFVFIKPQIGGKKGERERKECEFDVPIKIAITDDRCSEKAPFLFHFFKIKQYLNKPLIDWCVWVSVIYASTQ